MLTPIMMRITLVMVLMDLVLMGQTGPVLLNIFIADPGIILMMDLTHGGMRV